MAKITTIIDIGSNSMRMVAFKKTSRFGFHLINETKSRVKISEGSYNNNGNLQPEPMHRAFSALKSFMNISRNLKSRKIICVATSALRDAPNKKEFLNKVKNELGLNIKIIDGNKEAYFGGVAALNLLYLKDFITVDIGGGSTEFCIVKDSKIEDTVSLKIGTVRIKELYFNNNDLDGAKEYINSQLSSLFAHHSLPAIVAMGGTARALSKVIIDKSDYPLDVLHGFRYSVENHKSVFKDIIFADENKELRNIGIKKDRFDTIKEGTFIFNTILEHLNVKEVVTSGVGVREGAYLSDILRTCNHRFPANFNISIRSLLDRFALCPNQTAYFGTNASKIFEVLKPLHNLDDKYKTILVVASKLHSIGITLNFYKFSENAFNFILNGLSYGFTHEQRVLIAHIIKFSKKSIPNIDDIKEYEALLPDIDTVGWLSFMISLNLKLNIDYSMHKFEYELDENRLLIKCDDDLYLAKNTLDKLESPIEMEVNIV